MKSRLSYGLALCSLLVATGASAAPTYTTAATVRFVGLSSDANGYFLEYTSLSAPMAACDANNNRVFFNQWVNDSGTLTATNPTVLDQLLRLATAAYLSSRAVRLAIEVKNNQCYTRQIFLQ